MNNTPDVVLPLENVIPSDKPHHVCYDVLDETLKHWESKQVELDKQYVEGQKQHADAIKTAGDLKTFCDNVQMNRVVVVNNINNIKEIRKKITELDIA